MNQKAVFKVVVPEQSLAPDVFGLWQTVPEESTDGSTLASKPDIGTLWRAELPDDPLETTNLLNNQAYMQRQMDWYFPAAKHSLMHDLSSLGGPDPEIDFTLHENGPQPGDGSLRGILEAAYLYHHDPVSFSIFDSFRLDEQLLEKTSREVSQFTALMRRTVEQFALVETASAGRSIASTRITWTGDSETWWRSSADKQLFLQHNQVLAQALATRQHWLHFLMLLTSGIVRTAATLATGPFSLIAIWATWNYLQQVIVAFRKIRLNNQYPT